MAASVTQEMTNVSYRSMPQTFEDVGSEIAVLEEERAPEKSLAAYKHHMWKHKLSKAKLDPRSSEVLHDVFQHSKAARNLTSAHRRATDPTERKTLHSKAVAAHAKATEHTMKAEFHFQQTKQPHLAAAMNHLHHYHRNAFKTRHQWESAPAGVSMSKALDLKLLVVEAQNLLLDLGLVERYEPGSLKAAMATHHDARKASSRAHKEKDPKKKAQLHKEAGFAHKTAAAQFKRVLPHVRQNSRHHRVLRKLVAHHHYSGEAHIKKSGF